jgi:hypothetical protein
MRLEECRPLGIILHTIVFAVLRAVEFDDDFSTMAREIGDVVPDRHLPPKMQILPA